MLNICLVTFALQCGYASAAEPEWQRYSSDFYADLNPQTLYEMLEQTPGANQVLLKLGDTLNKRGFGSVGEPILINGKRLSGKENSIERQLQAIPSSDVAYIEFIRGTHAGLEVQSEGLIINVQLKQQLESAFLWSVGGSEVTSEMRRPQGALTYSGSFKDFNFRAGLKHTASPNIITLEDRFSAVDGTPTHTQTYIRRNWFTRNQLTTQLSYQASQNLSFQLNGLYQTEQTDALRTYELNNLQTDQQTYKGLYIDWLNKNWEVGGDITFQPNSENRLKLVFINNQANSDYQRWQVNFNQHPDLGRSSTPDFQLPRYFRTGETVMRGNWKHDYNSRHGFNMGGELAVNRLDETLQLIYQQSTPSHRREQNNIEEKRYEVFVQHDFRFSEQFNFHTSITYERAELATNTHLSLVTDSVHSVQSDTSREFEYFKPRLNMRYDLDDHNQIRARYERTVSQLDLKDFVPFFNTYDLLLEETNPALKPEVRDQFSLDFEQQWPTVSGSFTVSPYYHKITDLLNEIPLARTSGKGNIDSAKEWGVRLDTHFGLHALGLKNTFISANYTWLDSEVIDPFSVNNHPDSNKVFIRRLKDQNWLVKLTQNELIPGLSFNLLVKQRGDHEFMRHNQYGNVVQGLNAEAGLDYLINNKLKLKLTAANLLNLKYRVNRTRYRGDVSDNNITRVETRDYHRATKFTLSIEGRF